MRRGVVAVLAPLLACWAAVATAQEETVALDATPHIYKWIDENGIAHYTTDRERIPASLRNRADRLGDAPALDRPEFEARSRTDEFDSWVRRDRASRNRDAWDEALADDDGYVPPPSLEEQAEVAAQLLDIDRRIDELEISIAEDENTLKAMVSDPNVKPLERGDDPEFRAIAMRLPKRLAEVRALRVRRDELERDE